MRISVSDLDGWLYYQASDLPTEDFLRRLRHEEPPTQAMLAGRALHKLLEKAQAGEVTLAEMDGIRFNFQADCQIPLMPVREMKGEMIVPTAVGPVTLVGVIDGMDGPIYDHKLTERFEADRYADSYQWQAYLTMFGAKKFIYNVFEGRFDAKLGEWLIYGFQQFPVYAYPGMGKQVQQVVSDLAEFVARHIPERMAA